MLARLLACFHGSACAEESEEAWPVSADLLTCAIV